MFGAYEVQFAAAVLRLQPGLGAEELLALAVAARAPRFGHVCTPLDAMAVRLAELDGEEADGLPWPPADAWAASPGRFGRRGLRQPQPGDGPIRPLVWDGGRLYLHRYWHYELAVADDLARRCVPGPPGPPGAVGPSPPGTRWTVCSTPLFVPTDPARPTSSGWPPDGPWPPGCRSSPEGPGHGKTYTVARLLAAAHLMAAERGRHLSVALAAPTGKAAARMGEAVQAAVAGLDLAQRAGDVRPGWWPPPTRPPSTRCWVGRTAPTSVTTVTIPLPEDMVIVDETSMVSLPLMAKLLDAVRPEASVVLVGDPYQLASIEAGTVMSDVVGPAGVPEELDHPEAPGPAVPGSVLATPTLWDQDAGTAGPAAVLAGRVTVLRTMRRFEEDSTIAALADAVRTGDTVTGP